MGAERRRRKPRGRAGEEARRNNKETWGQFPVCVQNGKKEVEENVKLRKAEEREAGGITAIVPPVI